MIYIVEDDSSICELEQYALTSAGLEAQGFENGEAFWAACRQQLPELVVLDLMLPGEDGLTILEKLRRDPATAALPVILVTARDRELDVVKGLDKGADDYISKPFGVMEFTSRIKAALRRAQRGQAEHLLRFEGIEMDDSRHVVTVDGEPVELTFKEYSLLRLFLSSPGMVLNRDTIMQKVWDTDFSLESRTIDMHVRTLRQKLGQAGGCIQTVRKVGYKLAAEEPV